MAHKILVVDDQPFMVRLIQHHLERAGFELIKAKNSTEAEEALSKEAPQLVVMSDHLSSESTAAGLASTTKENSLIPVIRMTDVPATMPLEKSDSDSEVVFRKPFSPTKLVAEIKRLIPDDPAAETH